MASANSPSIEEELASVYRLYASLAAGLDPEFGLGGKLLYAGNLDASASRLLRAANVAGADSLVASADADILRKALRDGVIDFMVTTLDEALRILKNEIRKRQTVAVGVNRPPDLTESEMLERGVLPDLLPPEPFASGHFGRFISLGSRRAQNRPLPSGRTFITVARPADSPHHREQFDAALLEFLAQDDHANCRWFRLSPRFMPSSGRNFRSFECDVDNFSRILDRTSEPLDCTPQTMPES
jgi:urocanate hydratase